MRLEGTYTFPAPSDCVLAALTNPDAVHRAIPGCERLVQLGPTAADGTIHYEARVRGADAAHVATASISVVATHQPAHLRIEFRGRGPAGSLSGHGRVDLVERDGRTIGAYAWELAAADPASGERFARTFCERLATMLRASGGEHTAPASIASPSQVAVRTPRGTIAALPRRRAPRALSEDIAGWGQRALWMGTGLLIGMSAIGLSVGLAHWISDRDGHAGQA